MSSSVGKIIFMILEKNCKELDCFKNEKKIEILNVYLLFKVPQAQEKHPKPTKIVTIELDTIF